MKKKKFDVAIRRAIQIVSSAMMVECNVSKDDIIKYHCPSRFGLSDFKEDDCCRGEVEEICIACWNEEIEVYDCKFFI